MKPFHIAIHVRPAEAVPGQPVDVGGVKVRSLNIAGSQSHTPFSVSFEQTQSALQEQERMFVEPDGSFVRTGEQGGALWQLEGVINDRDGSLISLEAWGKCPAHAFDELLRACGWPATELMFFLVREGVWLAEPDFRRLAALD
jgi:hypothetical protein